jgi:hypothetical protein
MLASTCFGEERVESVITTADSLVTWHLTVRLNAMLQAEQLPASITDLNASLSKVKAKGFTQCCCSNGYLSDTIEE